MMIASLLSDESYLWSRVKGTAPHKHERNVNIAFLTVRPADGLKTSETTFSARNSIRISFAFYLCFKNDISLEIKLEWK